MYEYQATIVSVHDGDTATVDIDLGFSIWWRGPHIRMVGINAPEIRQGNAAGYASRDYLRALLPVGAVVVLRTEKDHADKYGGRWLGTFIVDGVNINEQMVTSGHAIRYNP